jgi:hypothetical protein
LTWVGKTHLGCALGHIAIRRRRRVHMAPAAKLFRRLKAARLDKTLDYEMRRLAGVDLPAACDRPAMYLEAGSKPSSCAFGATMSGHVA